MSASGAVPANGAAAPLLELRDVDAGYGPFKALFGINFAVERGRVLTLLGSNGSGKTTIARVCSGLVEPSAGEVLFDGAVMTNCHAYEFARAGVTHAPEGRSVFASLTVQENLQLALLRSRGKQGLDGAIAEAYELFPRLGDRHRQLAGTLSGGEQRMLSLARVLVDKPRLLIADELSLGLAPIIVEEVYATLGRIRDSGTTLLIVEQHVSHALAIADEVIVLVKGAVSFFGPVAELGDLTERLLSGGSAEPSVP
jgi:branched-chain amino acid transport system ATP-binding protein